MMLPELSLAYREALPFGVSSLAKEIENTTGNIDIEASRPSARKEGGEAHPRTFSSRSASRESHGKQTPSFNTHVMIIGFVLVLIGFCWISVKVFRIIAEESEMDGDGPRIGNSMNPEGNEEGKQNAEAWTPDTWHFFSKHPEMLGQKGLKRTDPDIAAEQAVLFDPRSLQLLPEERNRRTGDDADPRETAGAASSSADQVPESNFPDARADRWGQLLNRLANLTPPPSDSSDMDSRSTSCREFGVQAGAGGSPSLSETDGTVEDALEGFTLYSHGRTGSSSDIRGAIASSASGSVRREVIASSASGSAREEGDNVSLSGQSNVPTCDVGVGTDPLFVFLRVDQEEMSSALLTHRCDVKKLDGLKVQHNTLKKERSEAVHGLRELMNRQRARSPLPAIFEEDRNNAVARTTKSKKEFAIPPTAEEVAEIEFRRLPQKARDAAFQVIGEVCWGTSTWQVRLAHAQEAIKAA